MKTARPALPWLAPGSVGKEVVGMEVVERDGPTRFELVVDGKTAELVYEVHGDRMVLTHTGVPDELAGQGVGGRLVEAAIARAARDGLVIVPRCPFARGWIERHPAALGQVRVSG